MGAPVGKLGIFIEMSRCLERKRPDLRVKRKRGGG